MNHYSTTYFSGKFEDKISPARGFCIECSELLCENCCNEHNKFKTIRAHMILKGDLIPKVSEYAN